MQHSNNNPTPSFEGGNLRPVDTGFGDKGKKSLLLIEIEGLVKQCLVSMTNQMYGRNIKFAYHIDWQKGDQMIDDGHGKRTKDYYYLQLSMIDKNKSIEGQRIVLYTNYYPVKPGLTQNKLLEVAYKELLLNGIQSLVNVLYGNYIERESELEAIKVTDITETDVKTEELIANLKKDAKPKLII